MKQTHIKVFSLVLAAALSSQPVMAQGAQRQQDPELRRQLFERFDKNGDGQLDASERAAARKALGQHRSEQDRRGTPDAKRRTPDVDPRSHDRRRPRPDDARPAPAPPRGSARDQVRERLKQHLDRNGNGKLGADERTAARDRLLDRRRSVARDRRSGERHDRGARDMPSRRRHEAQRHSRGDRGQRPQRAPRSQGTRKTRGEACEECGKRKQSGGKKR